VKIEFISNASIVIELKSGKTILVDPWLHPAYHGSWYNFPPISDSSRQRYLSLCPDYIHISHIHPDHLDPQSLACYDKKTTILIGELSYPHLKNRLISLGFTNIYPVALNKKTPFLDGQITIFGDFHSMSSQREDLVAYDMDTSLWIEDANGASLFHVNDNVLTSDVAKQIIKTHGHPTVAIVPYSGASMYPHAFSNYSHEEKLQKTGELKITKLKTAFLQVAEVLNPKYVIPAAGSYVMGGKLSEYNQYLHQSTPDEVRTYWQENSTIDSKLFFMQEGDVLNTETDIVSLNENTLFRNFTVEDRYQYGKEELADYQLDHENIVIPDSFEIPWLRILAKCRRNLWLRQQQLNLFPETDVSIELIKGDRTISSFNFALDINPNSSEPPSPHSTNLIADRYHISFSIDWQLMMMVVLGATIWNNLEIGALMTVRRTPDTYDPTVHSLMSYFVL
jgi:UDP-MurNAc hydroxylase